MMGCVTRIIKENGAEGKINYNEIINVFIKIFFEAYSE